MRKPKQFGLFDETVGEKRREIVYMPLEPIEVDNFANAVCRKIEQGGAAEEPQLETVRGLSNFLRVVIKIKTQELNKKGGVCP